MLRLGAKAWRRNLLATFIALMAAQAADASMLELARSGSGAAAVAAALEPAPEVIQHKKKTPTTSAKTAPAPTARTSKKNMVVHSAYDEAPASKGHEGHVHAGTSSGWASWGTWQSSGFQGYILLFGILFASVVVALVCYYYLCSERKRTARPLIAETPARPVSQLREGEWAKVVGTVEYQRQEEDGSPLVLRSPLRGSSCVYFSVSAEALGKDGTHGGVVASRQQSCDFNIVDAHGQRVLVGSADLCAYHLRNVNHTAHQSEQLPVQCGDFLRYARRKPATAVERSYIFEEALIEGGMEVVAIGVALRHPNTGELLLQSDTGAHKQVGRRKGVDGFDQALKTLEPEEMHQLAAHVLVSDDPALF